MMASPSDRYQRQQFASDRATSSSAICRTPTASAWPERIYILQQRRIAYRGGRGPFDFDPAEAREALIGLLATGGRPVHAARWRPQLQRWKR